MADTFATCISRFATLGGTHRSPSPLPTAFFSSSSSFYCFCSVPSPPGSFSSSFSSTFSFVRSVPSSIFWDPLPPLPTWWCPRAGAERFASNQRWFRPSGAGELVCFGKLRSKPGARLIRRSPGIARKLESFPVRSRRRFSP